MPKPKHLSWAEAAVSTLCGSTAYRMLYGWLGNIVHKNDPVLIWGGTGGLGCMAIQLCEIAGAKPIAVVSNSDKEEFCKNLGAVGTINRRNYTHWGMLPFWDDKKKYNIWLNEAKNFGKAFWNALGEKRNPTIVIEHPGQATIPTSTFIVEKGGMVVICAGTSGYNATIDVRYQWMRQKRFQGSHFANNDQCMKFNQLVIEKKIDPCLSQIFELEDTNICHQLMADNRHPPGNMAIMVNALFK